MIKFLKNLQLRYKILFLTILFIVLFLSLFFIHKFSPSHIHELSFIFLDVNNIVVSFFEVVFIAILQKKNF